jgi:ribosomal protein L32E
MAIKEELTNRTLVRDVMTFYFHPSGYNVNMVRNMYEIMQIVALFIQ